MHLDGISYVIRHNSDALFLHSRLTSRYIYFFIYLFRGFSFRVKGIDKGKVPDGASSPLQFRSATSQHKKRPQMNYEYTYRLAKVTQHKPNKFWTITQI